ncbi:hypothetical protein AMECASPLE_020023 [Ameca splendens]|uniref:Uncharacterized protein n=1 Tax=Ameca splendens TaxID=208324 RepID=A0ABV0ZCG6_9TELE
MIVISWRTIRRRRASTSTPECFASSWLTKPRSSSCEPCPPSSKPLRTHLLWLQSHLLPGSQPLSLADLTLPNSPCYCGFLHQISK